MQVFCEQGKITTDLPDECFNKDSTTTNFASGFPICPGCKFTEHPQNAIDLHTVSIANSHVPKWDNHVVCKCETTVKAQL